MKTKNIIIFILVIVGIFASVKFILPKENYSNKKVADAPKTILSLHKSLTCGCCEVYGAYMKKEEYEVNENNMSDSSLSSLKEEMNIPKEIQSCHTSEIENYIIEGHIPNEAILKLLSEKPNIKGIGMAGMPSGSPGMPGPKTDFMIYEINQDGSLGELFLKM